MPAFFVHGVPDTHRVWNRVRAELDRDDVVAVDLPGFGRELPARFTATKDGYAHWVTAEIEAIGEPVDLVGHDWGSFLVQRVLATRPDLVRTCAFGGAVLDPAYVWHDMAQLWQTPDVGEQMVAAMTPDVLRTALSDSGVPADAAAEIGTHVDDTMRACILSLYRSAVDVVHEWALPVPAPVPTLVICGDDPYVPKALHEQVATRLDSAYLPLDCNHWWPLERPTEVAGALTALWATT